MLTTIAMFESFLVGAQPAAGSLLAQSGPSPSIQWAIVGFAIVAGLALTLSPSRRTYEIKRHKED
jgi:hypothetical protein